MEKNNHNGVKEQANPKLSSPQQVKKKKSNNTSKLDTTTEGQEEDNTNNAEVEIDASGSSSSSSSFPTARISRIIRSEAPDARITQEAVHLVNKATEQFLEQFCEEAYSRVAREHRKAVEYRHISSVVSEGKRYDFLSDFVPEKVRAEDALSERLAGI